MKSFKDIHPPRLVLAFFHWFCRLDYREDIEGDLLERFHNNVEKYGDRKANRLFIKDVLQLFRPGIIGFSISKQKDVYMKRINWLKLAAINILVVVVILSPFVPGPSNKIVLAASVIGQIAGTFGLLLVPIGLTWTIMEIRKLKSANNKTISQKLHYPLAVITTLLIAASFLTGVIILPNPMPRMTFLVGLVFILSAFALASQQIKKWKDNNESLPDGGASFMLAVIATACIIFIYLFTSLFAFVGIGVWVGIIMILILPAGLPFVANQIKKLKEDREIKFNRIPLYFLSIPLIAFFTFMFVAKPVSSLSRNFAIKRSEALIQSIEEFKNKTGQYPASIDELQQHSAKKILKPFVMGIREFRYNRINDQYSISFSQWLDLGSLEEIVLYDKSNVKDNLPAEFSIFDYSFDLHRVKGAFASHDTKFANWRYYHVD